MSQEQQKKVIVIGSGIGGIATACLLGKKGYKVTILEKLSEYGGRGRVFSEKGFTFDMGPSWYMMADVFEEFFAALGENINDYLSLQRLSPSYRIFLKSEMKHYDFYSDIEKNREIFESIEPGSGDVLKKYLEDCKYQYDIAKKEFIFKNYDSIFDFFNKRVMTEGRKLPIFKKMNQIVEASFKSEILQKVLQYQTVLLGTSPFDAPGIYALMNHVDFNGGVHYPKGGITKLFEALITVAKKNGVSFRNNAEVLTINVEEENVTGVTLKNGEVLRADIVVSNADIEHTDQKLLEPEYRQKTPKYWDTRKMAPSAFIMYLGLKEKVPSLSHHNLLFSEDWKKGFDEIFKDPVYPTDISLYVCAPSKSDASVAPEGKENLFILVPIAAGLPDNEKIRASFEENVLDVIEKYMGVKNMRDLIEYKRVYSVNNFRTDYNAFKGTALGLAHNFMQTSFFRPNNINKKVKNLYYVGAGTNPGIGMPICIASAELVYKRIMGITDPEPLKNV